MKTLRLLSVFLILLSGKLISQPVITSGSLALYQDGKLYFHLKSSSSVVVKNKDTITGDPGGSFHSLFSKYQVTKTERPFAALSAGLAKTYRISFNQTTRIDSFLLELSQIGTDVDYAEKVPAVYSCLVPNDPVYTNSPSVLYHLPLLNSDPASNIHISNGNAIVAIVDDAVLTSHEDLAANIGSSATTWTDIADADSDPNPPLAAGNASNLTHGTHVAGIAGAVTNNTLGIASIGWNNQLMCVKVFPDAGAFNLTNAYDGLAWAATHGAHVINMSWGWTSYAQTEYSVVIAAKSLDVVLVAAAGNGATSAPFYPAAYGEGTTGQTWEAIDKKLVVSVAALDQNSNRSVWATLSGTLIVGAPLYQESNYGYWVDIAAYGTDIMSTLAASNSTGGAINNQYGLHSGTSMAAPMVSGIAGVMRSYDMSKTADQIIDCLLNTANPDIYGAGHPSNQVGTLGSGRADAYAALRCLSSTCSVSPIAIISSSSPSLCPGATLTLTANQGSGYLWSTGSTAQSVTVSTTGVYNVTVSYAGGCTAAASINLTNADVTAHIDFLENSGPVAGDGIMCGLAPLQLYAHWGLGYQWAPITSSLSVVPSPGSLSPLLPLPYSWVETVTVTGVSGCAGVTATASALMQWKPLPTVTVVTNTIPACPGTAVTITASGANTYTFYASSSIPSSTNNPYLAMPDQGVNYTIVGEDSNGCLGSNVVSSMTLIAPYTPAIGSGWNTIYVNSALSGTYDSYPSPSAPGGYVINNDISVSGVATFSNSDVLFGPGVKLTVPSGSTLNILGSHLHTCPDDMWQGIVVQDGGALYLDEANGLSTLVEDAKAAIDVSSHSTSTLTTILDISKTIFNKNYVGINMSNYHRASATYSDVIKIKTSVFTCRDLPYTPNGWPSSGSLSAGSGTTAQLRAAVTTTTGQTPPYLSQTGFSITSLKSPYTGQTSHVGIQLSSVGTTTGSTYYGVKIGDGSSAGNFNLFDAQGTGISGTNSNITALNNVFQNMQYTSSTVAAVAQEGSGIKSSFNYMDGGLELGATSPDLGNRFWNCYKGVNGSKIFYFNIENAIFRSTQNSSLTTQPLPGNYGINLATGRFKYFIRNSEFTNLNTGINVPLSSVAACSVCAASIYATDLVIQYNTFNKGSVSGNYFNQAVNVTCPNAVPMTVATSTTTPSNIGTMVQTNTMTNIFRGISVQGLSGFSTLISDNQVTLANDNVFNMAQHGIDVSNNLATSTTDGQCIVAKNTLAGPGVSTTNSVTSLIFSGANTGWATPSVACNAASGSHQGFVFSGLHSVLSGTFLGAVWVANDMTNLNRGMVLTNTALIGAQGYSLQGTGNNWLGTWTGTNFSLFSMNSSTAMLSPLYYNGSAPPNAAGGPVNNETYGQSGALIQTSANYEVSCIEPVSFVLPDPGTIDYGSEELAYIADINLYRFLRYNRAVRDHDDDLQDFYDDIEDDGGSIYQFSQVEEHLYAGNYNTIESDLNSIDISNDVEANYKELYRIHATYLGNIAGNKSSASLESSLSDLCHLCPEAGGNCIYQARALYNTIFNTVVLYDDDCSNMGGSRLAHYPGKNSTRDWRVNLYPNPASTAITIISTKQEDQLTVSVSDLTGRLLLKQPLATSNFIATLELSLSNGAYLVTISNSKSNIVTKKLIIAK